MPSQNHDVEKRPSNTSPATEPAALRKETRPAEPPGRRLVAPAEAGPPSRRRPGPGGRERGDERRGGHPSGALDVRRRRSPSSGFRG